MSTSTHVPRIDEGGFTLVEMMTVMILLGVVLSAAYMVFGSVSQTAGATSSSSASAEEARRTVSMLTGEVRQAVEATEGLGVFTEAGPWRCTFYCDTDHDGVPEKVAYSVTNGAVYRTSVSSLTSCAPFEFCGTAQSRVYVSDLSNETSVPLFRYYDAEGRPTTVCKDISLVGVSIAVRNDLGGVAADTLMSTDVKVRSINSVLLD